MSDPGVGLEALEKRLVEVPVVGRADVFLDVRRPSHAWDQRGNFGEAEAEFEGPLSQIFGMFFTHQQIFQGLRSLASLNQPVSGKIVAPKIFRLEAGLRG